MEKVLQKIIDKHILPKYDVIDYETYEINGDKRFISSLLTSSASHQIRINLDPDLMEDEIKKLDKDMKSVMEVLGFKDIKTTYYFFPTKIIYMIFATI